MLEVTYRDNSGHKIAITKVTPLTDSVGLSTTNYGVTLSNNLTEKVNYRINVLFWLTQTLIETSSFSKALIESSIKTPSINSLKV